MLKFFLRKARKAVVGLAEPLLRFLAPIVAFMARTGVMFGTVFERIIGTSFGRVQEEMGAGGLWTGGGMGANETHGNGPSQHRVGHPGSCRGSRVTILSHILPPAPDVPRNPVQVPG